MRVFAAVELPEVVRADLHARVAAAPRVDGVRWGEPSSWHLTLAFCGDAPDDRVDALAERLCRGAARYDPFPLQVEGGGRFGDRVLWAGIADRTRTLRPLAATASAAFRRAGLAADERPYRPHLTLARARSGGADLTAGVALLAGYAGPPWVVDRITLVRSRLGAGPGGTAVHEPLATCPLRAVAPAAGRP